MSDRPGPDGPEPADAVDEVTASIQTLFRLGANRRIHSQQAAAAGLALAPQALRLLEGAVEAGRTTPGRLAARLDLDPAAVTRLLRSLEEAGMVERGRDPGDGRVSTVAATEVGRDAFERLRTVIWSQVRRALADWPEEDLEQLAGLLGRLVADVQREPYRALSVPNRL